MENNKIIKHEEVPGILAQLQKDIDIEKNPEEKIKLLIQYNNLMQEYNIEVTKRMRKGLESGTDTINNLYKILRTAYTKQFYFCKLAENNPKKCIKELKEFKKEAEELIAAATVNNQ